ncbi:MAG: hypothetical protein AAB215_09700, partial [Planctomycetota bacterium]
MSRRNLNRSGFTIYEVLVVLGIILFLVSLLVTVGSWAKNRSLSELTHTELSMLDMAVQNYYQDYRVYPKDGVENLVPALKQRGYFPFQMDRLKSVTLSGGTSQITGLDYDKLKSLISQPRTDIQNEQDRLALSMWALLSSKPANPGDYDKVYTYWPMWDRGNNRWTTWIPGADGGKGALYAWDSANQRAVMVPGTGNVQNLWSAVNQNTGDLLGYDNTNGRAVVWDASASTLFFWNGTAKEAYAPGTNLASTGFSGFGDLPTSTTNKTYSTGFGSALTWKSEGEGMPARLMDQQRRLAILDGQPINFQANSGDYTLNGDSLTHLADPTFGPVDDLATILKAEQLAKRYYDTAADYNALNSRLGGASGVNSLISGLETSMGGAAPENPFGAYEIGSRTSPVNGANLDQAIAGVADMFQAFEGGWTYDLANASSDAGDRRQSKAFIAQDASLVDGNASNATTAAEQAQVDAYLAARQNAAAATGFDLTRPPEARLADAQARAEAAIDAIAKGIAGSSEALDAILLENMVFHIQNSPNFDLSQMQSMLQGQGQDPNLAGALGRDADVYPIDSVMKDAGLSLYNGNNTSASSIPADQWSKMQDFLTGYSKSVTETFQEYQQAYGITEEQIRQMSFGCANWVIRLTYRNSNPAVRSLQDELEYWLSEVDRATYELNSSDGQGNYYGNQTASYLKADGSQTSTTKPYDPASPVPPSTYGGGALFKTTSYDNPSSTTDTTLSIPYGASTSAPPPYILVNGTKKALVGTLPDGRALYELNSSTRYAINWGTDPYTNGGATLETTTKNSATGLYSVTQKTFPVLSTPPVNSYATAGASIDQRAYSPESSLNTAGAQNPSDLYDGIGNSQITDSVYGTSSTNPVTTPSNYLAGDPRLAYLGVSGTPGG